MRLIDFQLLNAIKRLILILKKKILDEIFSVTTAMQQEEIEHVEEVEQQSEHLEQCLDESTIIEQDEEEIEEEMEEEEEDDGVFTLELSEGSDCEDKEYLGIHFDLFDFCSNICLTLIFVHSRICECSDILSVSRAVCMQSVSEGV